MIRLIFALIQSLIKKLYQVCSLFSPEKADNSRKPRKSNYQRQRAICHRKRRRLRSRLCLLERRHPESLAIRKIKSDLAALEISLADSITSERHVKENHALDAIKSNPRFFFSYAKQFAKSKSAVGPLFDKNNDLQSPE